MHGVCVCLHQAAHRRREASGVQYRQSVEFTGVLPGVGVVVTARCSTRSSLLVPGLRPIQHEKELGKRRLKWMRWGQTTGMLLCVVPGRTEAEKRT